MAPDASPEDNLGLEDRPSSKFLDIEKNNKLILILFLVLCLALFMDYQAKRHYSSFLASEQGLMDHIEEQDASSILEESQSKLNEELQQALKERDIQEILQQKAIPKKAESILGKWGKELHQEITFARKKLRQGITHKKKDSSKPPAQELQRQRNQGALSFPDQIQHKKDHYFLYFIRFHKKKSKLIAVKRPHNGGNLRIRSVLEALRKGPKGEERTLLNNFDSRIQIYSIKLTGGRLFLDLSPDLGRMGSYVIQDRLEQLAHTLAQFQQIDHVVILIEGKRRTHIGEDAVELPSPLIPRRPSFAFL